MHPSDGDGSIEGLTTKVPTNKGFAYLISWRVVFRDSESQIANARDLLLVCVVVDVFMAKEIENPDVGCSVELRGRTKETRRRGRLAADRCASSSPPCMILKLKGAGGGGGAEG